MTPDAAFRAAQAAGVAGPVYNDYDFGGYLIAHGVETFVDGRTDQLFLGDFLPGLQRALDSRDDAGFAALLTRYKVTWALVRTGSAGRPPSRRPARLALDPPRHRRERVSRAILDRPRRAADQAPRQR